MLRYYIKTRFYSILLIFFQIIQKKYYDEGGFLFGHISSKKLMKLIPNEHTKMTIFDHVQHEFEIIIPSYFESLRSNFSLNTLPRSEGVNCYLYYADNLILIPLA